jgi:hypothetical protein
MTRVFSDYLPGLLGTNSQVLAYLDEREPFTAQFECSLNTFVQNFGAPSMATI